MPSVRVSPLLYIHQISGVCVCCDWVLCACNCCHHYVRDSRCEKAGGVGHRLFIIGSNGSWVRHGPELLIALRPSFYKTFVSKLSINNSNDIPAQACPSNSTLSNQPQHVNTLWTKCFSCGQIASQTEINVTIRPTLDSTWPGMSKVKNSSFKPSSSTSISICACKWVQHHECFWGEKICTIISICSTHCPHTGKSCQRHWILGAIHLGYKGLQSYDPVCLKHTEA